MRPYFELIQEYFPDLSKKQLDVYELLWDIYHEWNTKINVISRKDIDDFYLKHVLHSLSIAKIFKFSEGAKILDVGTGGGFPGIPLAIYYPECEFTLIDSIGKKIKVVNEVIKSLDLPNVTAIKGRAEDLQNKYDIIVSRAVTQIPKFVSWVSGKINRGNASGVGNGIIYIKGGDFREELKAISWNCEVYEIPVFFKEEFFKTKKVAHLMQN
jgi:16S rRNA (guanine527-N7)-methyltransferase